MTFKVVGENIEDSLGSGDQEQGNYIDEALIQIISLLHIALLTTNYNEDNYTFLERKDL